MFFKLDFLVIKDKCPKIEKKLQIQKGQTLRGKKNTNNITTFCQYTKIYKVNIFLSLTIQDVERIFINDFN